MHWPNCRNVRDLAGLPIDGGGTVRPGALLRSDNLDQLTPEGLAAVDALGIARIIDVRDVWETQSYPSPYRADPRWFNVPLNDPADPALDDEDLLVQYLALLDNYPHRFAKALTAIAEAPPGPVLVHCHAGRDRTGLVIALTLAAIGVPADAIAKDYATAPADWEHDQPLAATMHAVLSARLPALPPTVLAGLKNRLSTEPAHQSPPAADAH
ncbi:tyrosine-protein phosphatase [Kribbella sp. NPDC058245]|uniref:tyrosine-protein phosphatase n=1 Tax=Kribbella sp. NPDC058245 TaxID=3346399 RepID=UPI0036E8EE2C